MFVLEILLEVSFVLHLFTPQTPNSVYCT